MLRLMSMIKKKSEDIENASALTTSFFIFPQAESDFSMRPMYPVVYAYLQSLRENWHDIPIRIACCVIGLHE